MATLDTLRVPLEVLKRSDDHKGISEFYFTDESHLRLFCHRLYGERMNCPKQVHLAHLFPIESLNVKTYSKGVQPVIAVCEFPTYSEMVDTYYEIALDKRHQLQERKKWEGRR